MNEMLNEIKKIQKSEFKMPKSDIGIIIVFNFLISGLALGKIEILKNIINLITEKSNREAVMMYMILLIAATGSWALLRYALTRYLEWRKMEAFKRYACMMTDRNLSLSSWKDSCSGASDRYLIMTKELGEFIENVYRSIPEFIAWLVLIPLYAVYLAFISVVALMVVLAVEVTVWRLSKRIQKSLPGLNRERRERYGKWMNYLIRTFENYDVMRCGVICKKHEEIFDRKAFHWNDSSQEGLAKLLTLDQIQNAGGIVIETILLLIGVLGLLVGRYEAGGVYGLIASVQTIKRELIKMPEMAEGIYETQNHYLVLEEFCTENEFEGEEGCCVDEFQDMELRNVNFSYRNGNQVISGFSYTFHKGGLYAVVGTAGTGKTTILLLMARLLRETSGGLYYNGRNVRDINRESLWEQMVYISKPCFIKGTVRDNIRFGRECFDVGLYEEIEREDGLLLTRTVEDEDCPSFSAGEKQRILIYRALCSGCSIMLLDEPFSNLDCAMEMKMIELMHRSVRGGKCIIITTHRGAVLESCTGIIYMDSRQG